jgi:hypothetical protein
MDLNEAIDMKKQLSIISFTHNPDEPEMKDDFWEGIDMDDLDADQMMADMEGMNLKSAKSISKKMSVMHSENVTFKYEYEVPNGNGTETVYISGQFNNWDFEEM